MKRLVFSLLLAIAAGSLMAQDTRIAVSDLVFTGAPVLTYGDAYYDQIAASITAPEGAVYHTSIGMTQLLRKNGDDWDMVSAGQTITDGVYRLQTQVRIDGSYGTTHVLADDGTLTCTIDGIAWGVDVWPAVGDNYSYTYIWSPDITVEKVQLPLSFSSGTDLTYYGSYIGVPIAQRDLTTYTVGGTENYTYRKLTNHMAWLQVTEAGQLSGTPDVAYNDFQADTLQVNDGVDSVQFRVTVSYVAVDPADREPVSVIILTAPELQDGYIYNQYDLFGEFTVPAGAPYRVDEGMGGLFKKEGDDEFCVEDGEALANGTAYYFFLQLRIDGSYGRTHVLANDGSLTCTVNGEAWEIDVYPDWGDNYSYTYIWSPVVVLGDATAIENGPTSGSSLKGRGEKILRNGQLLIETNGRVYNAQGIEVR